MKDDEKRKKDLKSLFFSLQFLISCNHFPPLLDLRIENTRRGPKVDLWIQDGDEDVTGSAPKKAHFSQVTSRSDENKSHKVCLFPVYPLTYFRLTHPLLPRHFFPLFLITLIMSNKLKDPTDGKYQAEVTSLRSSHSSTYLHENLFISVILFAHLSVSVKNEVGWLIFRVSWSHEIRVGFKTGRGDVLPIHPLLVTTIKSGPVGDGIGRQNVQLM